MTQKSAPAPTQQQMRVITSQLEVYARDLRRLLDLERGRAHDLARANKRLGLLDGLKQDFLRFIAHELRTPLEALTALELVDLTKPEEASELIGFAREGYVRLTAFVERGLAYFHSLSLDPRSDERTSLALVLALLLSDQGASRPARSSFELAPDLDDVAGSDKSLGEVLGVLLDNALKFGPPEGRPPARISARAAADGVVVEVSDHGVGFRPELGPSWCGRSRSATRRTIAAAPASA
ncbi:MAG: HAMP domain-containing sensor histidine kinase [Myxococcota bacterium]